MRTPTSHHKPSRVVGILAEATPFLAGPHEMARRESCIGRCCADPPLRTTDYRMSLGRLLRNSPIP
jgi:hypothetical protein